MTVSVEISYYPLLPDYKAPIIDFIRQLKAHPDLKVATTPLSTQVCGDYDLVMDTIKQEMKKSFENGPTASFVIKVLNVAIEPGQVLEF